MKKLLFMLLIFISFSAMSQTRPPIVTNEIRTNLIKWNDLLMYRDSLVYFRPVSETSFQVKRPSSSVWSTYDFTEIPDSFYVPDLNIWIVVGQPITRGDSTFYVRQKPNCPNCWQYSYDNTSWLNWFCAETGASNLSIDYNADDILGIHYNKGLGAYTDSLYFRAVEADSGKVPMIVGDSVLWQPIPRDSLFDAYSSDWLLVGDTIPIQKDTSLWRILDSTTITPKKGGVNIGYETHVDEGLLVWTSGNSITAWSSSIGVNSEADSIGVNSMGQNIGISGRSANGVGVKAYSHAGVAIDALSDDSTAINVVSGAIGINSYSQNGIAVNASSNNESAIVGESFYSNGVKGSNITGGIGVLGVSDHATGVKGSTQRGIGVYAEVTTQDGLPLVAQSTAYSPLVADFRGSQGIASNKLYLGGGTHSEKSQQLYVDGVQEIHGSSIENYGLLIRDSKGLYCDNILRLGGYPSGGVTYPSTPGSTGQFLRLKDSLTGILEFVDQDSSLWSISSTGIKSKTKAVAINSEIVDSYNLAIKADGSDNTLGLWNSGTGNILEGRNSLGASVFNVDKDGATSTTGLTVGSGKTITRSGTIASKDIWTGTAAEFSANTVKDGITPQASTTIAFILD
jgi:hypothetical protein